MFLRVKPVKRTVNITSIIIYEYDFNYNNLITYIPLTCTILNTCSTSECDWPRDILIALSKPVATWYVNWSLVSSVESSNGIYRYGKMPWMWAHVFTPLPSLPKILTIGTYLWIVWNFTILQFNLKKNIPKYKSLNIWRIQNRISHLTLSTCEPLNWE